MSQPAAAVSAAKPAPAPAVNPAPGAAPAPAAPAASATVEVKGKAGKKEDVTATVKISSDKKPVGKGEGVAPKEPAPTKGVVAVCPPMKETPESKQVRLALRKKREAFKPLPADDLKKLIREEDFVVDFYLSCTAGTSQGCAEKMKALAVKAGYSCFMAADPVEYEDPKFTNNMGISLNLHRCKAFIILITKQWLEAPECEFEYMIAQRLNMTSSRPVILPVICEELNLKDFPMMGSILPNLPRVDLSKNKDPNQGLSYALAMTEFLVSPSMLRLPAWRRQREALAYLSSELMLSAKQYSEEILPDGDYVGFFSDLRAINSARHDQGERILFRMSLKFEHSKIDKNNNDKEQKSIEFGGVGEDGGDIFRVEKATLDKDGAVEIVKKYVGKMSYSPLRHSTPFKVLPRDHSALYRSNEGRVKMNGKVKNFVLSGTYAHEEAKTPGGYWVMWPMRVYWKYRL